ncbi:MAG: chitin disaccharide deacetylase [Vibrionaceae bacterium]
MRKLIINADDFGLCRAQNYGIIEAFKRGVVSSTTAMVNQVGSEHAACLAKEYPALPIGLHFVLSLGKPLSELRCLVNEKGELGKWIWQLSEQGKLNLSEIEAELELQYQRFKTLFGKKPTHIDSHHHVHLLPAIFPVVERFAARHNLPLRIDDNALKQHGLTAASVRRCTKFDDRFYGNDLTAQNLLQLLDEAALAGVKSLEIMVHPSFIDEELQKSGYCQQRLTELAILTDPALPALIAERGFTLVSYAALQPTAAKNLPDEENLAAYFSPKDCFITI